MVVLMVIQDTLWAIFQPLPWLLLWPGRVPMPFHIHAKSNISKKNLIWLYQGLNPWLFNHKAIAQPIQPISVLW